MKKLIFPVLLAALFAGGCKEGPKNEKNPETVEVAPKNLLELLADKHGFENWDQVKRIAFTFNVDRGTSHFERSWIWDLSEDRVTQVTGTDTLTYQRAAVDSTLARADAAFINDKFWLLAPYQWVWDQENFTYEYQDRARAPISGDTLQRLTVVYGQEGGYTPGDAYDFYLGKDSVLREWIYRKGNQPEPSLATTWEGYKEFRGLSLATEHKNAEGNFRLYFTGIRVE